MLGDGLRMETLFAVAAIIATLKAPAMSAAPVERPPAVEQLQTKPRERRERKSEWRLDY